MHADEAVHADKFGTLLEGRGYAYDPSEYHGPTLYYLTLPSAWLQGATRFVEIDEATLRRVPAVLGVALVAAHLAARGFLGTAGAAVAALLCALSPALVFYSRYYIHETPFVFFSFGALLAVCRYLKAPGAIPALVAGVCAGLMSATKETALLVLACMVLAFALTRILDRPASEHGSTRRGVARRHLLLGLLATALTAAVFFSSFLSHPAGILDAARAYGIYVVRAGALSGHAQTWHYYLDLLVHFPTRGTPFWTEGLVLVLALAGGAAGWAANGVPGADSRALRFLAFYSLLMFVAYSVIPYKTPWCLLGFLHGLVLLAGAGAVFVVRSLRSGVARVVVVGFLFAATAHLGWQSVQGSFRFAADTRNPYVYAHTTTDVFAIVDRVKGLAHAHPEGPSLPVQVFTRENLWPLPFYLRAYPNVTWSTGVSEETPSAPVILLTPDMEPALVRKLYDVPPPGERELYVSIFERPVELRPGVEVRGYAAGSLWDNFRRLEAEAPAPTTTTVRP